MWLIPSYPDTWEGAISEEEKNRLISRGDDVRKSQLVAVRKAGGTWLGTIGSLTSVGAVVALVTARDDIEALSSGWEFVVGLLLLLATIGSIIAVVAAARAAIGDLSARNLSAENIKDLEVNEPLRAAESVRLSRDWTVLSVVAVLAAVIFTWTGSSDPASAIHMLYNDPSGMTRCGALVTQPDGTAVLIVGETPTPIPIADVTKLKDAANCPKPPPADTDDED